MEPKISIITPVYNSEKYIVDTIQSAKDQTYKNWEMIVVDDCSSDTTYELVEGLSRADSRIKLIRLEKNSGAAIARNIALHNSTGRFMAYLDGDDLWHSDKLAVQVTFMLNRQCGFSCTSYEVIDDEGHSLNKKIYMMDKLDYKGFLVNNLIQTVGVMVDLDIVPRGCLEMPNMKRRQDAATWLQILKKGHVCYGLVDVLAKYRRTAGSLSSNKIKAVKGVWHLYLNVEHLAFPFATYCFIRYAILAVWKRIYTRKK